MGTVIVRHPDTRLLYVFHEMDRVACGQTGVVLVRGHQMYALPRARTLQTMTDPFLRAAAAFLVKDLRDGDEYPGLLSV